jgi:integral membrane protein (TIGR01906 family)
LLLCVPLMLLSASLAWVMNSQWWYMRGFDTYDVENVTGLERAELQKAASGLIEYFNSDEQYIDIQVIKNGETMALFNEREVQHLKDVKGLFQMDYIVLLVSAIYVITFGFFLFWRKQFRPFAWGLLRGGVLTLAIVLALGIGSLFDFDQLFWQFHLLSFSNDFWLLDPTKDYLLMLFPQGFWYDSALLIVGATAFLAIIAVVAGYLLEKRYRINAVAQQRIISSK